MKHLLSAKRAALGAFMVGVVLTALAFSWQDKHNAKVVAASFGTLAQQAADHVATTMRRYEYGLRGARGAVITASPEHISRLGFRRYAESRNIETEFPGARGFGFIRRVAQADEAAFIEAARRDDAPGFVISQLAPHAGERYVIQYVEPVGPNAQAIGLDVASEAQRRAAAETAMHSGLATLTAPITLVQASGKPKQAFLLMLPIYKAGIAHDTPQAREVATFGWSYAALVTDEILGKSAASGDYTLALRDRSAPNGEQPFYASEGSEKPAAEDAARRLSLPVYGRVWEAEIRATPKFIADLDLLDPKAVAAGGMTLAVLATALAWLYAQSAARAEQLRAEQAHRAAIVETSHDAIVSARLDGRITSWNPAAQRIFGYAEHEVLGQPLDTLLPSTGRSARESSLLDRVAKRESIASFDTVRQRRNGSLVEVAISASPLLDSGGRVVGMAKTIRDISAQKASEQRLLQWTAELELKVAERTAGLETARRDLQTVLDALPSTVGYWDRLLCNRFANHAYLDWFGMEPASLVGKHMRELLGDTFFERNRHHVEAALCGEPQTFERAVPRPDGRGHRHALTHYLPDIVDGEVRGFYVLAHDVTELNETRQRATAAARDNDFLLRTIHQHAIVSVADHAGRVIDVNDAFCAISGYSRDELLGQTHRVVNSGSQGAAFWVDAWRTFSGGSAWRGEVCNRAKNGSLYWVDSIIAPFADDNGRIEKYISIRFDITDRKRAEAQLRATNDRFTLAVDAAGIGVWELDLQANVLDWDDWMYRLYGHPRSSHAETYTSWSSSLHPDDLAKAEQEVARCIAAGQSLDTEFRIVKPSGEVRRIRAAGKLQRNEAGMATRLIGVNFDVTELKEVQAKLEALNTTLHERTAQAEQANLAKSRFLANMSHEIRTPMNGVIGLIYLLGQTSLNEQQADFLGKIQRASKSLLGVISDILDISKIEAGELSVTREPFNPQQLLNHLADVVRVQTNAKNIAFSLSVPADLPAVVEGDALRLNQILTNLLTNAIKFTHLGGVRLVVRELPAAPELTLLRFEVYDTGIGISPEDALHLFQPFAQADTSITRRFGGTGLGLSIVKHLAELMGGRVGLESTAGVGSLFWVELGFARGHALPSSLPEALPVVVGQRGLAGVRALVVDDSQINLEVAKRILELEGAQVSLAANGQEAVNCLRAQPRAFDVVLMDVQMPVLDGLSATRCIRQELGLHRLPIIALTAGALASRRLDAAQAGMDDFISKPFEPQAIIDSIRRHVPVLPLPLGVAVAKPNLGWAAPAEPWHEIEGIETRDVIARMGADPTLFRSLLRHLLDEFEQVPVPHENADDAVLAALGARMHKLRGGAGNVGARGIQALATQAEVACVQGDRELALQLTQRLNAQLLRLRDSAGDWLSAPTFITANAATASGKAAANGEPAARAVQPEALSKLMALLRQQHLAAIDQFDAVAPSLRDLLGGERYDIVRTHVENLRFGEASRELALDGLQ